jgi:nicotinic acid mononucleotide adenylyltransferase
VLDASSLRDNPGTMGLEDHDRLYKIEIIDAPIVDISSTRIREGIAAGEDMSAWMM